MADSPVLLVLPFRPIEAERRCMTPARGRLPIRSIGSASARGIHQHRDGLKTIVLDLFDTPGLPGPASAPGIVTPDDERPLIAAIDATELTPFRFQGWTGKRLTSSFGWHYDFDKSQVPALRRYPIG